ncbi:MAG: phosphate acyltransferase PlsX [Oscillospiraceae bacterium]|jgi:glycerol-3-phosphate acyltransferase PlsX|nr:phosphate acyltransferase PlsX [Oscillospiraceae bacterium]
MKIIMDAMGGDHAPDAIVRGALQAAKEYPVEIVLVGRGADLLASIKSQGYDTLPAGVQILNAEDIVDMHADPTQVVSQHRNSSMVMGLKMLTEGADAFISAGNTGALLTAATLVVKRIRGIRRAALAPILPSEQGGIVLLDAGANAECTPEFLLQFACMGAFYAKQALGKANPRVALLNNGTEPEKGGELQKAAYPLLQKAGEDGLIHFVGNIEARDVPLGGADVIVADGFSGNVLLKTMEGTAIFMSHMLKKDVFKRSLLSMLGARLCMKGIKKLSKTMDYRETGGSVIVGISKPVIKAHGSSDALAIRNAIRQAIAAVESGFCEEIRANVSNMSLPKERAAHAE